MKTMNPQSVTAEPIKFFAAGDPPKTTAQVQKISFNRKTGRPVIYKPAKVKNAREQLRWMVRSHRPKVPFDCPIEVKVTWIFPLHKSDKAGQWYWHDTKPDCGNLDKALLDVLEDEGFYTNDSRIVREVIQKIRGDDPGILIQMSPIISNPADICREFEEDIDHDTRS